MGAKSWILEYDTFEPLANPTHPKKSFSSTMLMCAISRVIPGEPSLTSVPITKQHSDFASYMAVETAARLYLAQKIMQR